MGYNKKALSKIKADLNSAKAPAQPRDIIYDPMGQWKHPGQPTRIPGGNITMQGVSYPVMAYPNVGQPQMMYPNQDYVFPEADYVDEYPQMKKGGSKKFTRNIRATNKLFTKNPYLKKQKLSKRKVFDPNAGYFQYGGGPKLIYSPYSVNEFSGLSANPIYAPSQSVALTIPHLLSSKKSGVPRTPLQITLGRQYDASPEKLTNPAYNIETPMPYKMQDYMFDQNLPYMDLETSQYADVANALGKDVTELTQEDFNTYAAQEALSKLNPKYKAGKPIDANIRYNIQGIGQDKEKNLRGNLAFNVGYNPQAGFYGGTEYGGYGILGNVDPAKYFKRGLTEKGDFVLTPSLTGTIALRQKEAYPISQENVDEYRNLLEQDIAQGTDKAIGYYNKNLNADVKNLVWGARPELKAEYRPFKKLPLNLEGVIGANVDLVGKEAASRMGSLKPTISPYGRVSAVIPLKEAKRDISRIIEPTPANKNIKTEKPVKEKPVKELEPCPPGYRRDRPDGECVPFEAHRHPRWLKEGGKLGPIPLNSGRKVLRDWTYGESIGMLQEDDGGYIETELTPEEIQAYRDGGYVVEEVDEFQTGGQIYMYPGRKDTYYKKDSQGNWLIKSKDTGWKYTPIKDPKGTRTKLLEANAKPVQKTTSQKASNLAGPQAAPMPMVNALFDPNITARLNQERAQKKFQQQSTIDIPKALVSDNTRTVVPDFAAAAVMNRPRVDAAVKEKEKKQKEFEARKWKEYEKKSFIDQIGDRAQAFMVDPLGMASRFVSGEQAYIPGMGRGLVDRENPDYQNYLRSVGYTPGQFEISDVQNMINPMYWGASIGNNMYKGNYGTAALEAAGTFLPMMPKGSVSASNIKAGLNLLADDVSKTSKYISSKTSSQPSYLKTLAKEKGVKIKSKSLDKYAQDLPETLIQRRLDEFTNPNPRKRTIGSEQELEKLLKIDQYRVNKLKKQYPELDFNNPNISGYMFTNKEEIERIPSLLKGMAQNKKSAESYSKYLMNDYNTKMNFVKNSGNPVLMNIVDESPQYLDEVYAHLKKPAGSDEDFVNDLVVKSNTYTRFMDTDLSNSRNSLNMIAGKNINNSGLSMDVEGVYPSDWYGSYGYRIQPDINRFKQIIETPLEQKWSMRKPTFQSDIQMVSGMHTGHPKQVDEFLKLRNKRLTQSVPNNEFRQWHHNVPMESMPVVVLRKSLPKEFVRSKYYTVPQHQVFNTKSQIPIKLENFEVLPFGKINHPETGSYKDISDYEQFFEGTGKGFKKGGSIEAELTPEEIKWYKSQGYEVEELD